RGDGGFALAPDAGPQGSQKLKPPAGPHAIAIVGRGQEPAAARVAVIAEFVVGHALDEKTPLPQQRHRLAFRGRPRIEREAHLAQVTRIYIVETYFFASDPGRGV